MVLVMVGGDLFFAWLLYGTTGTAGFVCYSGFRIRLVTVVAGCCGCCHKTTEGL